MNCQLHSCAYFVPCMELQEEQDREVRGEKGIQPEYKRKNNLILHNYQTKIINKINFNLQKETKCYQIIHT